MDEEDATTAAATTSSADNSPSRARRRGVAGGSSRGNRLARGLATCNCASYCYFSLALVLFSLGTVLTILVLDDSEQMFPNLTHMWLIGPIFISSGLMFAVKTIMYLRRETMIAYLARQHSLLRSTQYRKMHLPCPMHLRYYSGAIKRKLSNTDVPVTDLLSTPLGYKLTSKSQREVDLERRLMLEYKRRHKAESERDRLRESISKVLSPDQVRVLEKGTMRGSSWSPEMVRKALQLKVACGSKGYDFVKENVVPLPAKITLQQQTEYIKFRPAAPKHRKPPKKRSCPVQPSCDATPANSPEPHQPLDSDSTKMDDSAPVPTLVVEEESCHAGNENTHELTSAMAPCLFPQHPNGIPVPNSTNSVGQSRDD
ncbi:hypothetical protein HPB49_022279 [Dermacentor silvarum]|uniref:Uncharacterized protein n=1 Tax=Dermacentor silvarum TaxID=543639 RepID=A0ACB8CTI7_DERSI|nr:hypothetical protein HPB49_022279 [Dermacentor silvarum]